MRPALVSVLLVSVAAAQVAPGRAIQSIFANAGGTDGLVIVGRANPRVNVTGLTAQNIQNVNSVALDPIDNSVWLGSINTAPTTHGLRRAALVGSTLGTATLVATLPTAPSGTFSGISFDQNGNPIVTSGLTPPNTGGVFRVNRRTGAVTNLLAPHAAISPSGTVNCVDVDLATGDIYFGVVDGLPGAGGRIFKLPGPFPNTAAPILVGTCQPASNSITITGVAFRPAVGITPARIYFTNYATGNTSVGYVNAAGGTSVVVAGAPVAFPGMNWIAYDRTADDFWLCTGGPNPDQVVTMSPTGTTAFVTDLGANGTPSALDANDNPYGSQRVVPQHVPTTTYTIEQSVTGNPGDIAVLGIDFGTGPIAVTAGYFDGSGTFWASYPGINYGPGSPGTIVWVCASVTTDLQTIHFINSSAPWPLN